jgi:hypothetical protein
MCKMCWAIAGFLLLVLLGTVYEFVFDHSTVKSADNRIAIQLTAGE